MLRNPYILSFIFLVVMGTILSLSSLSWFGVWLGMELNLLGIIPIMAQKGTMESSESSTKYFVVQASGSGIFFVSAILMSWNYLNWNLGSLYSFTSSDLMLMSLLYKMGAAPFHFWIPSVMSGLSWDANLFLLTWQKITPLGIISTFLDFSSDMLLFLVICSSVFGGIGGINQTSVRSMIAYSSIIHTGWMLSIAKVSLLISYLYFFLYFMIVMFLIILLLNKEASTMTSFSNVFFWDFSSRLYFVFILLSLGGLPPFLGFFGKLLVFMFLTSVGKFTVGVILILGSILSLYYYLVLGFSLLLSKPLLKLTENKAVFPAAWLMVFINLSGLMVLHWLMTF
uniref:NADH-ubiquinone oxidoreductase chain 2 n=1 Tax=Cyanoplax caverna TaxID=1503210 RepID=A0A0E3DEB4_9MOLL|nr:NADH dehydrogenase subunit 2 [Cyanoplax caverna]AIA77064.1 NADH dehydrogenase subunit 2 [Cyanoplax caverna]